MMSPDPASITLDLTRERPQTPDPSEFSAPAKYEMLECLGRGGCGIVFKARDRSLDRFVAIKFLIDAGPSDLERFRREAQIAAKLNDRAIVQVFEFGENSGQPFIAMQFVEGGSLATVRLPPREIVRAFQSVAGALARAHQAGIVHRDVKPANVLLDDQRRAYLSDFGLARDLVHSAAATLSREGALVGTPALMSPEQARGDLRAIDARCDIYAVGASLYTLVCGRYPFEGGNLVDLLHAVIHGTAPAPRSINPALEEPLERIIVKCMQKDPAWRYRTMNELAEDLESFLEGRALIGTATRDAGLGLAALMNRRIAAAEADLYPTVGVPAIRQLAAWDANLYRVGTNVARLYPQLDSTITRLDDVLARYPNCAWARFYRGAARFRRGCLDDALDDMESSIDRMSGQPDAQFEMGRLYLALFLREGRKAHQHLSRVGTRHHLSGARSRVLQATVSFREAQRLRHDLLDWQLEFTDAVARLADADYQGCIAVCDHILARDNDLDDVWRLRGDAMRYSGGDPIDSYDQAIRVRRSDYEAHLGKADAYLARGQVAEARESLRIALEIQPDCVEAMTQMARACLLELRDRESAGTEADRRGEWPLLQTPTDATEQLVLTGLTYADQVVALRPDDYDAIVTQGELLIERTRIAGDLTTAAEALETLTRAKSLKGCQNRVNYLIAKALLERARIRRQRGDDVTQELSEILALGHGDAVNVPDNAAWRALLAAARREMRAGAP